MKYLNLFIFIAPLLSHAEIYKWIDNEGNTQYSSTPPPSQNNYKELKLPSRKTNIKQSEARLKEEEKEILPTVIKKSVLHGNWREDFQDQTIRFYLSPTGKAEWKVRYLGKEHSHGKGSWLFEGTP